SFSYTTRVISAAPGGLGTPRMISTSESAVPGTWQLQPPSMHMAIWTICACAAGMKLKKTKPRMTDASLFLMISVPRRVAEKGAQGRLRITPTEIDRYDGVRIRDSGGGTCRLEKGRPII